MYELDFRDEETVWVWVPSYGTKYVEYMRTEVYELEDSEFKTDLLKGFSLVIQPEDEDGDFLAFEYEV